MESALLEDEDHRARWRTTHVERRAGVSYRQLDYWDRLGALCPTVAARGSGSQRLYSEAQLRVAWALGRLSQLSKQAGLWTPAARELESWPRAEWDKLVVITPGGEVLEVFQAMKRGAVLAAWLDFASLLRA